MRLMQLTAVAMALACAIAAAPAPQARAQEAVLAVQSDDQAEDQPEDEDQDQPSLEELRWIARPIVVFADSPADPRFAQQIGMLEEQQEELEERSVVILTDTDPAANGPLRLQLRPFGFGLVLIDLDGTIAQRSPAPTTARELINLIDRMPSRRQETGSRRR